jgi:tetratricopeptide (TPR) repeat protein
LGKMVYGERECFTVGVTRGDSSEFVGLGFIIDDRHILTCAHVVKAALGWPKDEEKTPSPDELIHVNFPLLYSASEVELHCRVAAWRPPPPPREASHGDVALLELIDGLSLPEGTASAMLVGHQIALGKYVSINGYIIDRFRQGEWAEPRVLGLYDHGRLIQLDAGADPAFKPEQGYSGSPVVFRTAERDMVIGMLTAIMDNERDSYAIPVNVLADIVPGGVFKDWGARYRLPNGSTEPAYRLDETFTVLEESARNLLTKISAVRMPVDFEFVQWLSQQQDDERLHALLTELVVRDLLRNDGHTGYYELPDTVRTFVYSRTVETQETHETHKRIAERLERTIIEAGDARPLADSLPQVKQQLLELMYQQVKAMQGGAAAETWENLLSLLLHRTADVTAALASVELLCQDDKALRRQIGSTATRARLRLAWMDLALQAGKLDVAEEVRRRLDDDPVAGIHAGPGQRYALGKFRDLYMARALLLRGRFARAELATDAALANIASKRGEIAAAADAEGDERTAVQLAVLEEALLSAKLRILEVDNRLTEIVATRQQLEEVKRRRIEAAAYQQSMVPADTQSMLNVGVPSAVEPGTDDDEALEQEADAARSGGAIMRELPMRMTIAKRQLAADRLDAAKRALDEVARLAEKNGLRCYLPETYCLFAEVTHRLGDDQAARQHYDRAVSAAAEGEIRHFEWVLEQTRQQLESGRG